MELTQLLCEGQQECMICQNKIYQKSKTWNCTQCFQPFHLGCMKKWIKKLNFIQENSKFKIQSCIYHILEKLKDEEEEKYSISTSQSQRLEYIKPQLFHWTCPKCNLNYNAKLPRYLCYCIKKENPDFSSYKVCYFIKSEFD